MRQPFTFTTLLSVFFASSLPWRGSQLSWRGWRSWRPEPWWRGWRSSRACPPWWEHKPPRSESQPGDEWNHFGRVMLIDHVPELGAMSVLEHVQPLEEEIKIRTHHDKVCSVWPLNLDWDVVVFLNFRCAIFLEIRFVFRLNMYAFSVLLQMCSNFGHWVTSLNVGRRQLVRFSGKTIYYCQEYRLDTLNFKGDQSEYSNYFVLFLEISSDLYRT